MEDVSDDLSSTTTSEARYVLGKISHKKAVGAVDMSIEVIKVGGAVLHKELVKLFTRYIVSRDQ